MRAHAQLRERRVIDVLVYVREYVRAYVRMSLSHSLSLSLSLFLSFGARVHSILAPLWVLHQEVVSVQQAGTPRTCLSLWQCSDRATHLSTDALPVSGGVVARTVPLSLLLFPPFSHPLACRLSLSLPRSPIRPSSTISLPPSSSINLSFSFPPSLLPYVASFSAPRLESLSTVRAPPHKLPCAPGANTNPCGSPDARRRRWLAKLAELSRATTPLSHLF